MAITFIPTVWAARLLTALEKSLVYGQANVCNRDYEGEIRAAGNTVKIASIGDVSVQDYVKDTDIDPPEVLTDEIQTLTIDQQKYFNFYVDDVDRAQMNVSVLDEANAPADGRFCIVPAWSHGLLLKDDRFIKAGTLRSDRALANGAVGEAAGFSVLRSNNVPNNAGTQYKIIAGHSSATSYVEQVLDLQSYRPEKRFGDAVKGLHVYGGKVVRPSALACLIANKA